MSIEELEIVFHLLVATLAGGLIGLERSFHGRPAGFRTHTLVCVASSLLMLVTIYASRWFPGTELTRVAIDPTRMAQGIMTGIGFYFPVAIATALTLGVLGLFRWIEAWMPSQFYALFNVRFPRDMIMPEKQLRDLVGSNGFTIANLLYRLDDNGRYFEYRMTIRSKSRDDAGELARALEQTHSVVEFRIAPAGD